LKFALNIKRGEELPDILKEAIKKTSGTRAERTRLSKIIGKKATSILEQRAGGKALTESIPFPETSVSTFDALAESGVKGAGKLTRTFKGLFRISPLLDLLGLGLLGFDAFKATPSQRRKDRRARLQEHLSQGTFRDRDAVADLVEVNETLARRKQTLAGKSELAKQLFGVLSSLQGGSQQSAGEFVVGGARPITETRTPRVKADTQQLLDQVLSGL